MDGREKILVVDDTPNNVHVLVNTFRNDYKVYVATNGQDALKMASELMPDIILLDIMMPGMDGYEVMTRLQRNEKTKMIPVMFISALNESEDEKKGLQLGVVDYIVKPFHPALVKLRVKKHLELNSYRKHLNDIIIAKTAELEKLNRKQNLIQSVMIESLGTLAEYRDPETGGHIKRTQSYVKAMAKHLQQKGIFKEVLTNEYIELLYLSAPLHDVGKVGVHDSILKKAGKLTDEEYEEMKNHTLYGYNTLHKAQIRLGKNSFISLAMDIAYTHHEKWDGTGYPRGLKGNEIPLSGRLMAVADVYDALISKRVYKQPFTHKEAVDIIINGDGRTSPEHFDPDILKAFMEIEVIMRNIAMTFADYEEERAQLSQAGDDYLTPDRVVRKVLLVEDHEVNMEVMKAQISELGYSTLSAYNGREALELLKENEVDLVITDLEMPVMDGYTLVQNLRSDGVRTPVFAVTSNDYDMNVEKAKEVGFDGYLLKPIDEEVLRSKIHQLSTYGFVHNFADHKELSQNVNKIIDFDIIADFAPDRDGQRDFLLEYLKSNEADYENLEMCVAGQDTEAIRKAAHRLKSAANMFGAGRLSDVCGKIEMKAMEHSAEGIAEMLPLVKERIDEISSEVRKNYA